MEKERKYYSSQEKVSIIRRHLIDKVPVSDVCDEYGIHPTLFYKWQQVLFERGSTAFETNTNQVEKRLAQKVCTLEAKLSQKNEVLCELLEEHVMLKKSLGER
ncbi:MAG: transposase [Nitrospirae bacterium]|nr:transposase [Nitrospirota bacterium]